MALFSNPPPLPSSKSSVFPPRTRTFQQWQSELNEVKLHYIKRQYKQCAARCKEVLKEAEYCENLHAVHEAYLHFYAAVSYETLGQAAHTYSSKKLPLLSQAKEAFVLASAALPLMHVEDASSTHDRDVSSTGSPTFSDGASTFASTNTSATTPCSADFPSRSESPPFIEKRNSRDEGVATKECGTSDSSLSVIPPLFANRTRSSEASTTPLSHRVSAARTEDDDLTPKPLFIKKKAQVAESTPTPRPLPLPPNKPLEIGRRKTAIAPIMVTTHLSSLTNRASLGSYLQDCAIRRFNNHLITFHQQLRAHIVAVNNIATTTTDLQREHRAKQTKRFTSFWSFSPAQTDGEADPKAREKKERIERLRDAGWMVRKEQRGFKGTQYYDELCKKALAELDGK